MHALLYIALHLVALQPVSQLSLFIKCPLCQSSLDAVSGSATVQSVSAHISPIVLNIDICRRWDTDVESVVRTKRVHGHVMGLRLLHSNTFRAHQLTWPAGWLRNGFIEI